MFKKLMRNTKILVGRVACVFGKHVYEMHPSDWVTCKYCNCYHPEE